MVLQRGNIHIYREKTKDICKNKFSGVTKVVKGQIKLWDIPALLEGETPQEDSLEQKLFSVA